MHSSRLKRLFVQLRNEALPRLEKGDKGGDRQDVPHEPVSEGFLSSPWAACIITPSPRCALCRHRCNLGLRPTAAPFALHRANKVRRRKPVRTLRRTLRYCDVRPTCQPKTTERHRAPHHRSRCLHATGYPAGGPPPQLLLDPSALVPPKHRPGSALPFYGRPRQSALHPMERRHTEGNRSREWRRDARDTREYLAGPEPSTLFRSCPPDTEEAQSTTLIDQESKERQMRKSKWLDSHFPSDLCLWRLLPGSWRNRGRSQHLRSKVRKPTIFVSLVEWDDKVITE